MRRFGSTLQAAPNLPANLRLTGLRGVGKSVLLKRFDELATEEHGWLTTRIQLEPRHNSEEDLSKLIIGLCRSVELRTSQSARVRRTLKGVAESARGLIRVSWQDIEVSLGLSAGPEQAHTMVKALFDTAVVVDEHGYWGYLLMLDEAQVLRDDRTRAGQHPLSLLIAAVNTLQERDVPIGLVLCGLPTLRTNLLRARTYSERMFRGEEVSHLAADEARDAFVRPLDGTGVAAADALVERVVAEVDGYPYFIQLWGAEIWDAARASSIDRLDVPVLDAVEPDIYRRLDMDFYDGRVQSLTPAEQDLLVSTASCPYPPLRTADIRERAGKSEANVNVLMGRLTEQGILFRTQKGQYEYTAPRFHEYLRRRQRRLER